jgi:hypothetical protein
MGMKPSILLLILAVAATGARAAEFKDLCEKFEPLRKLADFKYVKPDVSIHPKTPGVKPEEVVFTIAAKAGPIKVTPAADGAIEFPFSDKLCAENPEFQTNQPKGTVDINVSIDPHIPPVKSIDYHTLEIMRREWNDAIGRQSLVYRMLAPSTKGYEVTFEGGKGGNAEVQLAKGTVRLTTNDKGELRIPFDDSWISANPVITFSEVPKKIGLAFD